jgi:hypothetical protein
VRRAELQAGDRRDQRGVLAFHRAARVAGQDLRVPLAGDIASSMARQDALPASPETTDVSLHTR